MASWLPGCRGEKFHGDGQSLSGFKQPEQDAFVQIGIAEYHTFTANCCKNLLIYFQATQENFLPPDLGSFAADCSQGSAVWQVDGQDGDFISAS